MDDFDELAQAPEVQDEPFAPGVGFMEDIGVDLDTRALGSSNVSQAWQDNNIQNIMNNYGLIQSLQDLNMEELTEDEIRNIMRRYKEQNGSYGLTERQFYEVIEGLKGEAPVISGAEAPAISGGRKRRVRKTRKGGKKSKKSRKSRKLRKTRKGKKVRKGRKTRK